MRYFPAIVFLILCGVVSEARANKVTVYGAGTSSCGKWLESISDIDARNFSTSWLLGWVSAAENYNEVDLRETDAAATKAWVHNYCHAHPLDTLFVAAAALVNALAK
jgi:hypothetical protein